MSIDPRAFSPEKIQVPSAPWYPLPFISRKSLRRVKNPLPVPETCQYCGPSHPVLLVSNEEIYGKEYGDWPYAYLCQNCDSYVGLHPGTDIPLGNLADKKTRAARKKYKPYFTRMSAQLGFSRTEAYTRLAEGLGIPKDECHWAWFDAEQCKKAAQVCQAIIHQSKGN